MLVIRLAALLCWLCLDGLLWLMRSEHGPLLTVAHTCDTNGVMAAKSTSQGTSVIRAKSSRQTMFLIPFHFLSAKQYGRIS